MSGYTWTGWIWPLWTHQTMLSLAGVCHAYLLVFQRPVCQHADIATVHRQQKRKVEEGEDGHHEFDANQLREHEEFTKVKNVERIELGRFEMETWYFSPLPPEYKDCKVGFSSCA